MKLDLCLYGPTIPNGNVLRIRRTRSSFVVAPIDGDYFIDVSPVPGCNCGGTYTLSIGQTVPPEAARAERTDVEFVPGELIVRLRDPAPAALAGEFSAAQIGRPQPAPGLPSEFGLEKVAGDASREFLLRLPTGAARARSLQALGAGAEIQKFSSEGVSEEQQARRETLLALAALRERPEVASVSLNTIFRPSFLPNDEFYTYQWNYPLINLPQAWDLETGSPSVIVAVVDTGVRLDHPDLQGQLVAGYDFISDPSRARDGNGIDSDPNDPGDLGSGAGSSFHGTHVAGTIAAATNNGIGVAGIAFGAKVMPIRVLGRNGGTFYDVLQGVRYAARLPNDSLTLPAKRADIINLSLGGGGFDQTLPGRGRRGARGRRDRRGRGRQRQHERALVPRVVRGRGVGRRGGPEPHARALLELRLEHRHRRARRRHVGGSQRRHLRGRRALDPGRRLRLGDPVRLRVLSGHVDGHAARRRACSR